MTITVNQNSYITVAEAGNYWTARNNTTWNSASNAEKEKALIEATQYLDGAYEFIGYHKMDETLYPLAWPRDAVDVQRGNFKGVHIDNDTVPQAIKDAQAELALEALSARLDPVLDRGGHIKKTKVDVIEVEYMDWAVSNKTYNFVTKILKPYIKGGGTSKPLVRA